MKKLVVCILAFAALTASAQSIVASKKSKMVLLNSINKQLVMESADSAIDYEKSLSRKFTVTYPSEGIARVKGIVRFNAPNRKFDLSCSVSFYLAKNNKLVAPASCK